EGGRRSEETDDVAVVVEVDTVCGRSPRQAWHGLHLAGYRIHIAGPSREPDLAHRQPPARGGAPEGRVGGDREVRLRDDDRQLAVAEGLETGQLLRGARTDIDPVRSIDLCRDLGQLGQQRLAQLI